MAPWGSAALGRMGWDGDTCDVPRPAAVLVCPSCRGRMAPSAFPTEKLPTCRRSRPAPHSSSAPFGAVAAAPAPAVCPSWPRRAQCFTSAKLPPAALGAPCSSPFSFPSAFKFCRFRKAELHNKSVLHLQCIEVTATHPGHHQPPFL